MIRNALIAFSAAGAMGLALAPAAEAKTKIHLDVGFNIGGPGIYVDGPGHSYDDDFYYGDDCHYVKVKHKKWNKAHTKKIVYFTKELVCY